MHGVGDRRAAQAMLRLAVWQSGSLAVWQSGSLAIWQSGSLAVSLAVWQSAICLRDLSSGHVLTCRSMQANAGIKTVNPRGKRRC